MEVLQSASSSDLSKGKPTPLEVVPHVRTSPLLILLLYTDLDLLKVICPHPSGIQAVAATTDFKWVFTAGADGVIRRFDFFASMNGKLPLTQLQKHGIPDIITKVRPPLPPNCWKDTLMHISLPS